MSFTPPPLPARRRKPSRRALVAGAALAILAGTGYLLLPALVGTEPPGEPHRAGAGEAAPNARLLFTLNCASCHQTGGQGVPGMYPPLAGSEWVTGDERVLADIMLHGVEGEMTVRGVRYEGMMPAFWRLSDAELAAVATYVRSTWSNRASPVTAELFAARRALRARDKPLAGERQLRESGAPAR